MLHLPISKRYLRESRLNEEKNMHSQPCSRQILDADAANPTDVYIFNAADSGSWSKQKTTPSGADLTSMIAILDHDTNVFCRLIPFASDRHTRQGGSPCNILIVSCTFYVDQSGYRGARSIQQSSERLPPLTPLPLPGKTSRIHRSLSPITSLRWDWPPTISTSSALRAR